MSGKPLFCAMMLVTICFAAAAHASPQAVPSIAETAAPAAADADAAAPAVAEMQGQPEEWNGSIMFPADQLNNLYQMIRAYRMRTPLPTRVAGQPGDGTGVQAGSAGPRGAAHGGEGAPPPEEVLNVTLNALLYHGEGQWSIWLNGRRFSKKLAEGGIMLGESMLRLTAVSHRRVTLVWTPVETSYHYTQQNWERKRKAEDLQDVKGTRVVLDEQQRAVIFDLAPNTTFVSRYMTVMEGSNGEVPAAASAAAAAVPDMDAEDGLLPPDDGGVGMLPPPQPQPVQPEAGMEPEAVMELPPVTDPSFIPPVIPDVPQEPPQDLMPEIMDMMADDEMIPE